MSEAGIVVREINEFGGLYRVDARRGVSNLTRITAVAESTI
jgi:hypothetical protein